MTIESFRAAFSGRALVDGDDGFGLAPYPAGAPSIVARPESVADVAAALHYARENDLAVSVRSGGHGLHSLVRHRPKGTR